MLMDENNIIKPITHESVIKLLESEVEQLTAYIHGTQNPPQIENGSWGVVLFSRDGIFPDGARISLEVVHDRDNGVWCQGVLYDKQGAEIGCTENICRLLENIEIQSNAISYVVKCELTKPH